MARVDAIRHELSSRLADVDVGKKHLSIRYESGPRIVRVGACISEYTWETRSEVIDRLLAFEADHAGEFAVEFDVVPLEAVNDPTYAEA